MRTGNLEDHLNLLGECDLVIEAIIERMDAKQALFQKLERVWSKTRHRRRVEHLGPPHLGDAQGPLGRVQKNFLVMHF
ncbi:MAG: 3-hydroxyacyl-CoA dehydrogenase NAD-binding domain-containing protein [Polyangiales bacterium]